jgi:hypothetical protein
MFTKSLCTVSACSCPCVCTEARWLWLQAGKGHSQCKRTRITPLQQRSLLIKAALMHSRLLPPALRSHFQNHLSVPCVARACGTNHCIQPCDLSDQLLTALEITFYQFPGSECRSHHRSLHGMHGVEQNRFLACKGKPQPAIRFLRQRLPAG